MRIIRKNSRPYQILKYLALGSGILTISLLSPLAGSKLIQAGIKSYFRKKRFEKEKFINDLKNLQKRDLVDIKESKNREIEVKIRKNGKDAVSSYKIEEMKLKIPAKWDKKWRLIMFDIPHDFKKARDAFRERLRNLNFYHIQKSVFITPYPCEEEIDFITSFYNIRDFVLIFYIDRFEDEEKIRHYFKI